jgi:tetratricopeptide (TPR) repeat protein
MAEPPATSRRRRSKRSSAGVGCDRAGDIPRVQALAEQAADEARRIRDDALLGPGPMLDGHAHLYRGALRECLLLAAQTEAVARRAGDDLVAVRLYSLIGNCEFQFAQHAAARETLEAGIALADAHGFAVSAATMWGTLGSVLGAMGRFDEGEAAFSTSIAGSKPPAKGIGGCALTATSRDCCGAARSSARERRRSRANATFGKAIEVARGVYDVARRLNDAGQLPYSLGMLGALYRASATSTRPSVICAKASRSESCSQTGG